MRVDDPRHSTDELIAKLTDWFGALSRTVTAFSGGVDSSVVLYFSHRSLGDRAIGCIGMSPSLSRRDYALAVDFCERFNIGFELLETRELEDTNYLLNPPARCFYCKTCLYGAMRTRYPDYVLLSGTNHDDLRDYRPGIKAGADFAIRSPLAECGLAKSDVRLLARHFGLPNHAKPASPCLSSRVPYGQSITLKKLQQIEAAEEILNQYGFEDVRVRHRDFEAMIEVPKADIDKLKRNFEPIAAKIKAIGFSECKIDMQGLVSGKLNRGLSFDENI